MAAFAQFYRDRDTLSDRYFKLIEEAQEKRELEFNAAVKIQRLWRRHRARQERAHRNKMAIIIQKMVRKHQAKVLVQCLRVEKARFERIAYFNLMATKIQKVWRGYDSRRHIFDFSKQQKYLSDVAAANERMRRELDDHYARTNEAERRAKFERQKRLKEEKALHQHYLVSTAAIPSIFQPPAFTKDASVMPAVENFIRNVNKAKIVIPSIGGNTH